MLFIIIYAIGLVAAGFAVADLLKNKNVRPLLKVCLTPAIFLFSWIGSGSYYLVIRSLINTSLPEDEE